LKNCVVLKFNNRRYIVIIFHNYQCLVVVSFELIRLVFDVALVSMSDRVAVLQDLIKYFFFFVLYLMLYECCQKVCVVIIILIVIDDVFGLVVLNFKIIDDVF
jgi:hypothetical protein